MSLLRPEDEGDGIEVAWEDQQRINTFSKLNNRLADIKDQLKVKQEEKEYYDDLSMELELADDDKPVLYKLGESFFSLSLPAAKKQLRGDTKRADADIGELERRADECQSGMNELKVHLYAKFGKQINLET
ncbi:Prefoldin subunit 4 [Vanrija pseudolonga]|uniref:Prefoldin subunit 4 n=1 Tax=Vanrija pseudolonga TaxID=143232 RepID=A0AAF1BL33_9TREE|nr:Prefoldin subunit 4 [Vanrija pseudolonga]